MDRRALVRGAAVGAGLAAAGLALRLAGLGAVGYPLEGLYGALTHLFGVPTVFNRVHRLPGSGERARPLPDAGWLVFEAADDYRESLPLAGLPPDALVAYATSTTSRSSASTATPPDSSSRAATG